MTEPARRPRILVVDDSRTALMRTCMALPKAEFEVETAADGAAGYTAALERTPDLVLLDVVMPEMDGLEVCRKLRQQEKTRTLPIIIVTTRGEEDRISAGLAAGCDDYVTKPIDTQQLLEKIRRCLDARK